MICQFHFCVYTQKNWKQGLKEIFVYILFIYSPLLAFVNNAPMNISVQIYESIYMLNSKVASLPKEQCDDFLVFSFQWDNFDKVKFILIDFKNKPIGLFRDFDIQIKFPLSNCSA